MLRKGKVVGHKKADTNEHTVQQRRYLQSGGLRKLLEQTRAKHTQQRKREEALPKVVFDSPPSVPETEGHCEGRSKKARKSLNDEIDDLVEEAPAQVVIEPEELTDEIDLQLPTDEAVPKNLIDEVDVHLAGDQVDPQNLPVEDYLDSVAENEEPVTNVSNSMNEARGSTSSGGKKRGKTKLLTVKKNAGVLKLMWNEKGQPIGSESILLSSYLGVLVREIVPYTLADWRKLPESFGAVLWAAIKVYLLSQYKEIIIPHFLY